MSYDVHITRRVSWTDEGPPEITQVEWESVAAADRDLTPGSWPGSAAMLTRPGDEHPFEVLFWGGGVAYARYPSELMIAKMCLLAQKLAARVLDDDDIRLDAAS